MRAVDFFHGIVADQKGGRPRGTASVCSAHPRVLESAFLQASGAGVPVLLESTVNQVNQFGGYTGMTPSQFRDFAIRTANSMGFAKERLLFGGDHLGPFPWRKETSGSAMAKARDLVADCVAAGYSKIHLDASMPLADDPVRAGGLDPSTIADREAELAEAAEKAFAVLSARDSDTSPPVYVIGTEVPAPGGAVETGQGVSVTPAGELSQTVNLCEEAFARHGLRGAWPRVCAVVAQPGVEYGDHEIHGYDRAAAAELCRAARALPGMVLEGHSTDYQTAGALRQLVDDGVAILKVGPALTFAVRECLFALELIEKELAGTGRGRRLSGLRAALDHAMISDPSHWKGYYGGSDEDQARARSFSLSDRSRYYWGTPSVEAAVATLHANLDASGIPLNVLSQYLPLHSRSVREGRLEPRVPALVRESVRFVLQDYAEATGGAE